MQGSQIESANRRRIFFLSNLAIFLIGLGFAVRTNIAGDLQADLFDVINLAESAAMVGKVLAATFIGFALTLLFGGALVDIVGMRTTLVFAGVGYVIGSLLVVTAATIEVSNNAYWLVYVGFLLTGLGWGAVEAATNPLVATLYPDEKTHRLNILHAWWPAGIVAGGLCGLLIGYLGLHWLVNLLILIVPALGLLFLTFSVEFPVTQRVASGKSYRDMFVELRRSPGFFIWLICMMGTVTTELAPGQWVDFALSNVVGMPGIWVLIYVSALMFVMRHFAGPIVAKISSTGLLAFSCVAAACGLYFLSVADSPLLAFAAATVWGVGVCYLYPTMLGNISERYPGGGALFLGITGFAGGMASQFVLPFMGQVFDESKLEAAGGVIALQALQGEQLAQVIRVASVESFQVVAIIPVILFPIFVGLWAMDKYRGINA
ncbi:MAG: MFS transporter [Gammaproteobacteria bacterium]|nr:MFS transporter [Gammaproteobacteria bacterium]